MAHGQPNTNNRQKDISRMLRDRHARSAAKRGAVKEDKASFLLNEVRHVK